MQLVMLGVEDVVLGDRMRRDEELDEEFLDSIRDKGIIQPITVNQNLELMAGGRRLAACKFLGIEQIPAVLRQSDDELDLREVEYIENAFRKDLNWQDRNASIAKMHYLMDEKFADKPAKQRWSLTKTAKLINRSVGGVHRCIQMYEELERFPSLKQCKTEDEAVKILRQVKEAAAVQMRVKQHEERVEEAKGKEKGSKAEGTEKKGKTKEDARIRRALNATIHYNVGDAFKGMERMLEDGLKPPLALVEIDPPYAIDLKKVKKGEKSRALQNYEEIPKDEYQEFLKDLCELVYQTTPDNTRIVFWFGVEWYETVKKTLTEAGFKVDPIPCLWTKRAGQTNAPELYLARAWEPFFVAWKGEGIPIHTRGRINVFDYPVVPASKKYHPTQRPVELMQDVLRTFAWPGSIIMVPFLGSGTTIRAAYREDMNAFGWDLNDENKKPFLAAVEQDIVEYFPNHQQKEDEEDDNGEQRDIRDDEEEE